MPFCVVLVREKTMGRQHLLLQIHFLLFSRCFIRTRALETLGTLPAIHQNVSDENWQDYYSCCRCDDEAVLDITTGFLPKIRFLTFLLQIQPTLKQLFSNMYFLLEIAVREKILTWKGLTGSVLEEWMCVVFDKKEMKVVSSSGGKLEAEPVSRVLSQTKRVFALLFL